MSLGGSGDNTSWTSAMRELAKSRLWLLFLSFAGWMGGIAVMAPHVTPVSVNWSASRISGDNAIQCDGDQAMESAECKTASAHVVFYVSVTAIFSNALFGFLVNPLVGWLSDMYGRKPFYITALLLSLLPFAWVSGYLQLGGSIPFAVYYVFDALRGAISPLALVLAAAADVLEPSHRATVFSLVLVGMSIALIFGAGIGALLSSIQASQVCVILYLLNIGCAVAFVPETLTKEKMENAVLEHGSASPSTKWHSTLTTGLQNSLGVLKRNNLFMKLAIVMGISGAVFECVQDLLFNYLMITLGFKSSDLAKIFLTVGLGGLVVQAFLLPALLRIMAQKQVLVLSLVSSTAEMFSLAICPIFGAWAAYASIIIGAPGSMAFPVISALKSVHAGPEEQGKVQGALVAARCLAQGLGPLGFSMMFTFFTKPGHYHPGAPIVVLGMIMAAGAMVAATIKVPPPRELLPAQHNPTETVNSYKPTQLQSTAEEQPVDAERVKLLADA